jgi:hypothetical protein
MNVVESESPPAARRYTAPGPGESENRGPRPTLLLVGACVLLAVGQTGGAVRRSVRFVACRIVG